MLDDKTTINTDTGILYSVLNSLSSKSSIKEISEYILTDFKGIMNFDLTSISLFENNSALKIRYSYDSPTFKETIRNLTDNEIDLMKKEFHNERLQIIQEESKLQSFTKLFGLSKTYKILLIFPLITNNHIIGFLLFAYDKLIELTDNKKLLLKAMAFSVSFSISNVLVMKELQKHNTKLQEIAKTLRHDFANDLQSIDMSIELLLTTEISDEQNKFIRLLSNAKNSALGRLREFTELKSLFEKSIELRNGIPL